MRRALTWCGAVMFLIAGACTPPPDDPEPSTTTTTTTTTTPPAADPQVSVGPTWACAVRPDGTVACWGRNDSGQLGDGSFTDSSVPVDVVGLDDVRSLSTGEPAGSFGVSTTCAVTSGSRAWCWGSNSTGNLGEGGGEPGVPQQIDLHDVVQVSVGNVHVCARLSVGAVSCWGWGIDGRLGNGDGSNTVQTTPVHVGGLEDVVDVAAGTYHSCAVRSDGTVWCWGLNGSGHLGTGDTTDHAVPVQVLGIDDAIQVSVGSSHTCALRSSGEVACWGSNDSGQLGDGTTDWRLVPVHVVGVSSATAVSAGDANTCARLQDGTAACWGANRSGAMGLGTIDPAVLTPTAIPSVDPITEVSINGQLHFADTGPVNGPRDVACVVVGPRVRCAGSNEFGQLGNATLTDSRTLVDVAL